ncbi:MAG: repair protein SbcD/Mre11 [Clostridiales bacterium]|nr:repair protein SbcD/Mre11 [Clostridiales bacterium]
MKLLHTADLHIGKLLHEYSLLEEQKYVLDEIVTIAKKEAVQAVLIAGDVYDRAIPPSDAVIVLSEFLTKLTDAGICVCMVSGNHDSPERISFGNKMLEAKGLYIAGEVCQEVKKVCLQDEFGEVNLYLLPFAKPATLRYFGYEGGSYGACVADVIRKLPIDPNERNILVTHHFIGGGGIELEEPEAEYPIHVGGIDMVDYHCMEDFDYVALGHIHRGQSVGKPYIRYAGSPYKYSFSEALDDKKVLLITLGEKKEIAITPISLHPKKDLRAIKGELSMLLSKEVWQAENAEDYLSVTLTDKQELYDPLGKLRAVYPNICKLVIEKNLRHDTEIEAMGTEMTRRSPLAIFEEFYEKVTDEVLDEESKNIMCAILEEVGGEVE